MKQISDFKLQTLEDKLNQAAELLTKNNRKNAKAAYIGIISELIIFFKSEYPDLNREPLKKLLTDSGLLVIEHSKFIKFDDLRYFFKHAKYGRVHFTFLK